MFKVQYFVSAVLALSHAVASDAQSPNHDRPVAVVLGPQDSSLGHPADTSLLGAVVREIKAAAGKVQVRVDPRPLRPAYGILEVTHDSFLRIPEDVLELRRAFLLAMGIESVDAAIIGQNERCAGDGYIRDKDEVDPHAGCPAQPLYVVALGLPQPGSEVLPENRPYEKFGRGPGFGFWALRVVGTSLSKSGSSVTTYDYVLRLTPEKQWQFVEKHALIGSH